MPESFYNQASGRLSIEGSKMFLNCNPGSPFHWFKKSIIDKTLEKNGLYVHFTMDDNLSLSDEIKDRYKSIYTGVWKSRFIDGLWTASSGLIYDMFDKDKNQIEPEDIPYELADRYCVAVDYGTANATVFLLMFIGTDGIIYVCKEFYFCGRAEAEENGDYDTQKTDLEFSEDAKTFVGENYNYTGLTYTNMPFIVDPAANSFKLQLRRRRFRVKNANNDVLDGVRDVASLMVQGRFKVSSECTHTLQEIHTYSWDSKAQETTGVDKILKKNDHCITGDTLIDTVNGMTRIDELVGKEGFVHTINPETLESCTKRFYNVRKTRENAEIITLELFNQDKIQLTPDHLVLTINGWAEANSITLTDLIIKSDGTFIKVKNISMNSELHDVYNMEVEDTECFSATNSKIIIHNCSDAFRYGVKYLNKKGSLKDTAIHVGI